jgi:hypothetical protein
MKRFTDLATCIAKELKVTDAVLDGEIVAVDGNGRPAFYDLMKRQCRPVYYAFDILWLNRRDLRSCRLLERKKISAQSSRTNPLGLGCELCGWRRAEGFRTRQANFFKDSNPALEQSGLRPCRSRLQGPGSREHLRRTRLDFEDL